LPTRHEPPQTNRGRLVHYQDPRSGSATQSGKVRAMMVVVWGNLP
jgi:hypothetical protein